MLFFSVPVLGNHKYEITIATFFTSYHLANYCPTKP